MLKLDLRRAVHRCLGVGDLVVVGIAAVSGMMLMEMRRTCSFHSQMGMGDFRAGKCLLDVALGKSCGSTSCIDLAGSHNSAEDPTGLPYGHRILGLVVDSQRAVETVVSKRDVVVELHSRHTLSHAGNCSVELDHAQVLLLGGEMSGLVLAYSMAVYLLSVVQYLSQTC